MASSANLASCAGVASSANLASCAGVASSSSLASCTELASCFAAGELEEKLGGRLEEELDTDCFPIESGSIYICTI